MKSAIDPGIKKRRLMIRAALVAVYLGLAVVSFIGGKGHTILIDNKDATDASGAVLTAIDGVMVSVDGGEALELYSGDRDKAAVQGQRHGVSVEVISGGQKVRKSFSVPLNTEMLILSVPKALAGVEPFVEVFVPLDILPPAGESVGNTNSFTSPDAIPVPGADVPVDPPVPPAL